MTAGALRRRALQVALALFGLVLCVEGLLDVIEPVTRARALGLGASASRAGLPMSILGGTWVAIGIATLTTVRRPAAHRGWTKFLAALACALILTLGQAIARGYARLDDLAVDLVVDAVFATAFLLLPVRRARNPDRVEEAPRGA
ncbi:MAG: hypothetical protein AB7S26_16545 [Sandaracinaceae bacterium]